MKWSHRALLFGLSAVSFSSACIDTTGIECGDSRCGEGQVCDVETRLCIDNSPPEIEITTPAAGSVLTGATLEVVATITDDQESIATTEVTIDDGATWVALEKSDAAYTASLPLPSLDSQPLTIRVRAVDTLEQETTSDATYVTDNVAPNCTAVAPLQNAAIGLKDGPTYQLQFTVTDGSGEISSPQISVGDPVDYKPATISGGTASLSWTLPDTDYMAFTARFRAQDSSGNLCERDVPFFVDTVAPTLTVTNPDPTISTVVGGPQVQTITYDGTVIDGAGVGLLRLEIDLDDGNATHVIDGLTEAWTATLAIPTEDHIAHATLVKAIDPAGNTTSVAVPVVVDNVGPVVTISSPMPGSKLNIAALNANGTVPVAFNISDGDATVETAISVNAGGITPAQGSPYLVQTSPTDNPAAYNFRLEAKDRAGNLGSAETDFSVDRVAPTPISITPAAGARLTAPNVSVTFNEPVTFTGASPITLSPSGGTPSGASSSAGPFSISGLLADTVYEASIAAGTVTDAFGNPNAAVPLRRFHTVPKIPASGSTLLTAVSSFDAVADDDGVITIVAAKQGGGVEFGWIEPKTGGYVQRWTSSVSPGSGRLYANASRKVLSSLAAERVGAYHYQQSTSSNGFAGYFIDSGTVVTSTSAIAMPVVVPVEAGCLDPAGAARTGKITSAYERNNMTSEQTGLASGEQVAIGSANAWDVFEVSGTNFNVNRRVCKCSGTGASCQWGTKQTLLTTFNFDPEVTAAYPGGSKAVVTGEGGMTEICYEVITHCTGFCITPPPVVSTHSQMSRLYVAKRPGTTRILGTSKNSSGFINLMEKDLATGCGASWTVIGTAPNVGTSTYWSRPVMAGDKPAVIYLEGTNLKLWYP